MEILGPAASSTSAGPMECPALQCEAASDNRRTHDDGPLNEARLSLTATPEHVGMRFDLGFQRPVEADGDDSIAAVL